MTDVEIEKDIANRAAFEKAVNESVRCDLCEGGVCEHPIYERIPWSECDRMFAVWNVAQTQCTDALAAERRRIADELEPLLDASVLVQHTTLENYIDQLRGGRE